jgi:hypothetical protein
MKNTQPTRKVVMPVITSSLFRFMIVPKRVQPLLHML